MNKLLERQIKIFFGDVSKIPIGFSSFTQAVSDTYDGFDQDRNLMERSLELSSQELIDANKRLRVEAERQKAIVADLRNATIALRPNSNNSKEWLTSKDEAVYLANSLSKLIEEQKQHEKQLEISKERTEEEKAKAETILNSIGDGVFAVDIKGRIMLMNAVAEELCGYTFKEAGGKNHKDIFHFVKEKDQNSPYPPFVEDVMKTGIIQKLANHTLLIRKDKTSIPVSDSAASIKDMQGRIFGCIVVIRDASRERELEQAKDDFVSISAHQLRTPLGSMRWRLEMFLRQPNIPPKIRERMQRIYLSNQRMIGLVNDLLNVSRIDQGRVQDEPELTNVCEVIRAAALEMEAEAQEHNVSIDLNFQDDGEIRIMIDAKRFREIIQNLLSNAVKYNVPGGRVMVGAISLGDHIRVSVADTGIGIPKADQARIFSKFSRAQNAARSDTTGSGLGLFVVKFYVDKWGGRVGFKSTEGKGTTFWIELPNSQS